MLAQRRGGERRDLAELAVRRRCARSDRAAPRRRAARAGRAARAARRGCGRPRRRRARARRARPGRGRRRRSGARSSSIDMNGIAAAASASSCATVLPPLRLVRSASVRWVGHLEVEGAHQLDELGALALLQARIVGDLLADRRVTARPCSRAPGRPASASVELQQLAEQAVVERLGIAGRQVGAAGAADQQRVAGEHAVGEHQAHRIVGVAGRVEHAQAQLADDDASRRRRRAGRRTAPGCRGASPPARRAARASSRVPEK